MKRVAIGRLLSAERVVGVGPPPATASPTSAQISAFITRGDCWWSCTAVAKGLLYGAGAAAAAVTERRGTTAAHVLDQYRQPTAGSRAARAQTDLFSGRLDFEPEHKTNNRNRATKASMEPVDESEEASAMARRRGPHHS